ncbi:putative zinc-binding alcohol protein [Botryosphaeria dothidea]|uniref:alcohol dehydrogenase (NADP(+)) n=1 Tax=Botryosphaeria dothidea TaxID=55169 RepID=A0A8H4IN83_9PEZI|nr:putative zinc-binding alcohol protein [Botryosphaeria dothidea]
MSSEPKFEGWCGLDPTAAQGNMRWQPFTPKPFAPTDVDIQISHCGICGSDIHTLRSGWGQTPYPCVVGHEIIGKAVRVGADVKHIKQGDRVGVGAQSASCLQPDCEMCADGNENHCPKMTTTYAAPFPDGSGLSYGGYANYNRCPSHFVIKIPEGLPSEDAAPMMCGGITVYSPLKRNGCGPGKRVGIVGLGGLGHFGVLFAKALGAEKVVVISRTGAKKKDAEAMGADGFIATDEEKDWAKGQHANSLDLIISTVSSPKMPLMGYLSLLRFRGAFIQVGAPEDTLPGLSAFPLIMKEIRVAGSAIGPPHEIEEMLQLAAERKLKPWVQPRPMKEANQAVVDFEEGKPRYRYVLVNEENLSKM